MSKLAKALEKAKKSRGEGHGRQEGNGLAEPGAPARENGEEGVKPAYSMTKVVEVSQCVLEESKVVACAQDSTIRDQYSLLRTQILHKTREKGWNTIMVSSCLPGEGKTLTSINLAVSIALEVQQTALLVDVNMRNPRMADYFNIKADKGLTDYLLNDVPISELMINPGLDKLVVLPAGRYISGATEFIGSPKMKSLVKELKNRYPDRYVIYDCPHILDMPDTLVFSSYVDAVILIVQAGKTSENHVKEALKLLEDRNILGVVFNRYE
jgi:exopolysaccharide/PEP-CTERM locus tyrosine autokinase